MRFPRSLPKLHKPRLSLRAALVMMAIVGFGLIAPAWKIREARRQRELIEQLKQQGMVQVYYDFQIDEDLEYDWESDQTATDWLPGILGKNFFHQVVRIDDARNPGDRSPSYKYLKSFPALRALSLTNSHADIDLAPLRALDRLERLQVRCGAMNDDDLAHIAALPRLHTLVISGNSHITDEGLQHLMQAGALKQLDIKAADVSEGAIAELENRLPQLQVNR